MTNNCVLCHTETIISEVFFFFFFKNIKIVNLILMITLTCGGHYVFMLSSVFADGQLLVVWSSMGNFPPISLSPALSHLSYLLAQPTERAILRQMDRNISP